MTRLQSDYFFVSFFIFHTLLIVTRLQSFIVALPGDLSFSFYMHCFYTWEDNIKEWMGIGFGDSLRAVEDREGGKVLLQRQLWCQDDLQG